MEQLIYVCVGPNVDQAKIAVLAAQLEGVAKVVTESELEDVWTQSRLGITPSLDSMSELLEKEMKLLMMDDEPDLFSHSDRHAWKKENKKRHPAFR